MTSLVAVLNSISDVNSRRGRLGFSRATLRDSSRILDRFLDTGRRGGEAESQDHQHSWGFLGILADSWGILAADLSHFCLIWYEGDAPGFSSILLLQWGGVGGWGRRVGEEGGGGGTGGESSGVAPHLLDSIIIKAEAIVID